MQQLQTLILNRQHPFSVVHICAHSGLPGPLAAGNTVADSATKTEFIFPAYDEAAQFHRLYHVNSKTLRSRFPITRQQAREIVLRCGSCSIHLPSPSLGVNPRGTTPLHIWQMDVTHIVEFGRLKYVHVSVDTCSGVIYASVHSGEAVTQVIAHCLAAWSAWGRPKMLKTDNGPAYTSKAFSSFCATMGLALRHGIPYNPQGQGVVERAHRTLKVLLEKQEGGIGKGRTPRDRLSLALFTINFLSLDDQGQTAAERHHFPRATPRLLARWKDVCTGRWCGPDPVLTWSRGAVCVFPQDAEVPCWVPERLIRFARKEPNRNPGEDVDPVSDRSIVDLPQRS
uniref:RNA-directed DNA polymerase n=1 Tax=Suricata suricatta TaxID=37032 RepID=A0A673UG97_SURSU